MEDKVLTFVARAAAAIITGGGLLSVTNGAWIGRLMLGSFEQATDVSILNQHLISDDLYRDWGREIFFGSAPAALGVPALVYVALALLLLGHILFKPAVSASQPIQIAGPAQLGGLVRTASALYIQHYHLVTGILMMALAVLLLSAGSRVALATRFIVFAVPVIAYLVYYVKDVRSPQFKDVFLYVYTLLVFGFTVVALPGVYGQRFFDLQMRQVPPPSDAARGPNYLATFVVDESRKVVCHVYGEGKLTLELEQVDPLKAGITSVSLRKMATETAARKVADPGAASSAIDRLLKDAPQPE